MTAQSYYAFGILQQSSGDMIEGDDIYSAGEVDALIDAIELTPGPPGADGSDGADGQDGADGLGWTGGSYDAITGKVTFTSDDGLGFETGDLRGADGASGVDGAPGADGTDGADGQDADVMIASADPKATPVDADTMGLIDSAASNALKKVSWSNIKATIKAYFDTIYAPKNREQFTEIVLTAAGKNVAPKIKAGIMHHSIAGTITTVKLVCDPANKPVAESILVDVNSINLTTGDATSIMTSAAIIAVENASGTGTINGTQSVAVGDQTSVDIDQGSDGKELRIIIGVTPNS